MTGTNTADSTAETGTAPGAGTQAVQIVFSGGVFPDKAILHDNERFAVQWAAHNAGTQDTPAFTDALVVYSIPEGCPGSDDQEHPVMFSSDQDGNAADYAEGPIPAGQDGAPMQATVGPFPTGSYRLTVTLARGLADVMTFNCIEIIAANAGGAGTDETRSDDAQMHREDGGVTEGEDGPA